MEFCAKLLSQRHLDYFLKLVESFYIVFRITSLKGGVLMVLKLEHVTKRFGQTTAVDNLSLSIPENEMFGFLGGNGAGKTTAFRMILGLLNASEGRITWKDERIDYSKSALIGYLPEERGLYPKLKVKEQIIYLARLRGMSKQDALKQLTYWLEKLKVPQYMDKKVEELSKGNQQKIQFISAVIHQPELLILDEPFSGLDPVNVEQLKNAVSELKKTGTTIVFSSHRMDHVEEMCEHLCILHRGKPVVHGALREIKRGFGKKNVTIHADMNMDYVKNFPGVTKMTKTAEGVHLQINDEQVADYLLKDIVGKGFIRKFDLEEPSLNDIFIEKVGAAYE